MSYFIAHTISFSKDFKTFKVKGGDNNVVPRMNYWSNDIPIDRLYYNLNGGMIQLKGTSEKNCFIRFLIKKSEFGGNWNDETDYYHMKNNHPNSDKVKNFDKTFINELKNGLADIDNFARYMVEINGRYVVKANPTSAKVCSYFGTSRKFTEYRAREIANQYSNKNPKVFCYTDTDEFKYLDLF